MGCVSSTTATQAKQCPLEVPNVDCRSSIAEEAKLDAVSEVSSTAPPSDVCSVPLPSTWFIAVQPDDNDQIIELLQQQYGVVSTTSRSLTDSTAPSKQDALWKRALIPHGNFWSTVSCPQAEMQGSGHFEYKIKLCTGDFHGIGREHPLRLTLLATGGHATISLNRPRMQHECITIHLQHPVSLGEIQAVLLCRIVDEGHTVLDTLRGILTSCRQQTISTNQEILLHILPQNLESAAFVNPVQLDSIFQSFSTIANLNKAWFLKSVSVSSMCDFDGEMEWNFKFNRWVADDDSGECYVSYGVAAWLPSETPDYLRPVRDLEGCDGGRVAWSLPHDGAIPCVSKLPLPIDEGFNPGKEVSFADEGLRASAAVLQQGLHGLIRADAFPSLESIHLLYQNGVLPTPWRAEIDMWKQDDVWGASFLVGPNAGGQQMRKITALPAEIHHISDEVLSSGSDQHPYMDGTSLSAELKAGRIFLADFSELKGVVLSKKDSTRFSGFQYCAERAMCLLRARPSSDRRPFQFLPLCIVLDADAGSEAPVFLPTDLEYEWLNAKAHLMNAYSQVHQIGTHFMYCHAAAESVCVAVHNHFSTAHPLRRLLYPRTQFTLAINAAARGSLINPAGLIENAFALGPHAIIFDEATAEAWRTLRPQEDVQPDGIGFAVKAWSKWDGFLNLPKHLAKYGLDGTSIEMFPFRDDAKLLWDAMYEWIRQYVEIYYKSDEDVAGDIELRNFIKAVIAGLGQAQASVLEDYSRASHSRISLVEFIVCFVFQVSVGHAAANFNQFEFYGFPAFQPTNMQKPPPIRKGECTTEREFLDALPRPSRATLIAGTVDVLSTYSDGDCFELSDSIGFEDPRVHAPLQHYTETLQSISALIKDRNKEMIAEGSRHFNYPYLDPQQLTTSVAI